MDLCQALRNGRSACGISATCAKAIPEATSSTVNVRAAPQPVFRIYPPTSCFQILWSTDFAQLCRQLKVTDACSCDVHLIVTLGWSQRPSPTPSAIRIRAQLTQTMAFRYMIFLPARYYLRPTALLLARDW